VNRFDGKTALITGGAQGIGRGIAERFGAEGANLVLLDIEGDTLERTVGELRDKGWPVEGVTGDVASRDGVRRAVAAAVDRFGRLDVLVSVAGITELSPLLEVSDDTWRRILDVNLTGMFLATQEAASSMARSGGGAIVLTPPRTLSIPRRTRCPTA
jgi:NAD(P)-dependent dehydrogenase (short-subunit alcohol dehydrogenase family)